MLSGISQVGEPTYSTIDEVFQQRCINFENIYFAVLSTNFISLFIEGK